MPASFKHKILNMFREVLMYHSDSLAFRAKLLTLLILGNGGTINECEEKKIEEIASTLYPDDHDRASVFVEVVHEFYDKISERNNLVYDSLVYSIDKDIRSKPRFAKKIDTELFTGLKDCIENEEERIFHDRIISYLNNLKEEYGEL